MNNLLSYLNIKTNTNISKTTYNIICDYENTTEKQCIRMDSENERIYNKLLNKAKKANNTLKNSSLSMNIEVPIPPRPSNRDRLIIWKKRNVSKPVIEQSESVLFLNSKGYNLNEHYEAYQAIELSNEIKIKEGIEKLPDDKSKQFDNIYTNNDKNILRRRSTINMTEKNIKETPSDSQKTNSIIYDPEILIAQSNSMPTFSFPKNQNSYIFCKPQMMTNTPQMMTNTPQMMKTTSMSNEQFKKPTAPPLSHNIIHH